MEIWYFEVPMADPPHDDQIARYADMMAALGTETRLRIVRLLLSAHPYGLVVGEIHRGLSAVWPPWVLCTIMVPGERIESSRS